MFIAISGQLIPRDAYQLQVCVADLTRLRSLTHLWLLRASWQLRVASCTPIGAKALFFRILYSLQHDSDVWLTVHRNSVWI